MIIPNGKLTRIDAPAPATAGGDEQWTPGPAVDYDVTIDQPTRQQQWTLGTLIAKANAVIYVMMSDVGAGAAVPVGCKVVAHLVVDGVDQADVTYRVLHRIPRVHDELSHFELFCQEVASS